MRKSVRLILALFAVLMILSGTVSADEYDSMWDSFLDYDTGTSQGNYSVFSGSTEFSYTLPFRASVRSVQGIIHASSHPITAVKFGKVGSSITYPCTLISLGNSLYRFYLSRTDVIVNSNDFFIIVENDGTASTVASLLSFEFSQIRSSQYQETGSLYVTGGHLDGSFNETMSNTGDSVVCSFPQGDSNMSFEAQIFAASWRKYDFLDFWVSGYIDELGSISAGCNGAQLPVSVYHMPVDGSSIVFNTIIRLDLRSIPRTSTYTPMILLDGFSFSNGSGYIQLKNVVGIVEIHETDPELSILNRILNDMNWYLMSDFSIQTNMSGDIVSGFSDLTDAIGQHFESFQSLFTDTISGFRSSMESYLDALPARIAEELAKIFQPTEGHFEEAADQSSQLAEEKLGAVYQAAGVIDQIAGAFTEQTTQTFIAVPVLRVMVLPDVPFEFGGWEVPVVPPGMESVFEVVKFAVDIVCTLAFLNGMKRRLERFLGGASDAD